jgi:hypothetical protein
MARLNVLFEYQLDPRHAYLCADQAGNFLVLLFESDQCVNCFVTEDLLFGIGHAHSYLMKDHSLAEIEALAQDSEPIRGLKTRIDSIAEDAAKLTLLLRGKELFSKVFDSLLTAEMVADSYLAALQGWGAVKARQKVTAAVQVLAVRENDQLCAQILRLEPAGATGIVLRLLQAGEEVLLRFGLFPRAVEQSNALVVVDQQRQVVFREGEPVRVGAPLILEVQDFQPEPVAQGGEEPLFEYALKNVRTVVAPASVRKPPGFRVDIFLDGHFLTSVLKDQNQGGYSYTLPQAIKKAQDLLKKLQHWHSA